MNTIVNKKAFDITGLETFLSQYKYHEKLIGIKSSMGAKDDSNRYSVLRQVFLDKDMETIQEMIGNLTYNFEVTKSLLSIVELNNIIISLVDSLEEGKTLFVNKDELPYPEVGISCRALDLIYFYKQNQENWATNTIDYNYQLQKDKELNELIDRCIEKHFDERPVEIECIKCFLASQFIFGKIEIPSLISINSKYNFNSFCEYVNSIGICQYLPAFHKLNDYLVKYQINLLYLLNRVIREDKIQILKVIYSICCREHFNYESILQNNIRELDFTLNLNLYVAKPNEPTNEDCIYLIEPNYTATLVGFLLDKNSDGYFKDSPYKNNSIKGILDNVLGFATYKDFPKSDFLLFRRTREFMDYKILDFSINGLYPNFTSNDRVSKSDLNYIQGLVERDGISIPSIIYLYLFGTYRSHLVALKALDLEKTIKFVRAYEELTELMRSLLDDSILIDVEILSSIIPFCDFFDIQPNNLSTSLNQLNERIITDINSNYKLTPDEVNKNINIDFGYCKHNNFYELLVKIDRCFGIRYTDRIINFKPYLNKTIANPNLVKFYTNVSNYYIQLVELAVRFVHLAQPAKNILNSKCEEVFANQSL